MTYNIIRYTFKKKSKTVKKGLTLKQAQNHCKLESTQGKGWFEGYVKSI